MNREEKAIALHDKKYNCCQAVVGAFCEETGVDGEILFKAAEGFGLGMGCTEETCGALTGAIMLAGLMHSDGNLNHPGTKAETYRLSKAMVEEFRKMTGATKCGELKGIETGTVLCSCSDCICCGVKVAEKILNL